MDRSKMEDRIKICLNCGSVKYIENYPALGRSICFECGHEISNVPLKTIELSQEIPNQCPFCGEYGEDTLFERDDVLVLKCTQCGKPIGYCFSYSGVYDYGDVSNSMYDPLTIRIAEQEGNYVISASRARELARTFRRKEKAYAPIRKCKKRLDFLIYEKKDQMKEAGISPETISEVCLKIQRFIEENGPVTERKLNTLLATALSLIQKLDQIYYKKYLGKRLADSQLEEIFGVTRKTIRKWRKILQDCSPFSMKIRWDLLTHRIDQMQKSATIKIPEDVESLIRLAKPRKNECDHCRKTKLLSNYLQLIDGSWSNLCEKCANSLMQFLTESQIC